MLIHAFAGQVLDGVQVEPLRDGARGRAVRSAREGPGGSRGAASEGDDVAHGGRAAAAPSVTFDVQRVCARTFRSSTAPSTASRSSIWTTPPRRRSRAWCSTPSPPYYSDYQRQRPPRRARAERARDRGLRRRRASGCARSSTRRPRARSSSPATRPRGSTWSPSRSPGRGSRPATRCSSRRWSTIRTSSPGSWSARRPARRLTVAPIDDRGDLILEEFERRLTPRTRLLAITHMSNALGTITPVARDRPAWRTRTACRC